MKGKLFIIVIVLAWIVACTQTTEDKTQLVASDVTKIEIISNGPESPMEKNIKVLSRGEINRFVDMWNSSEPSDQCKFYPAYEVRTFLKDGTHLTFRMNDTSIKENNETCYQLDYKKLVKFIEE